MFHGQEKCLDYDQIVSLLLFTCALLRVILFCITVLQAKPINKVLDQGKRSLQLSMHIKSYDWACQNAHVLENHEVACDHLHGPPLKP